MKKIINSIMMIPTPSNISLMWNFGSMLGLSMLMQIISGLFLSMNYCGNIMLAFNSYIYISKIIENGLILQMIHAHFSSIIFIIMYLHIFKSLMNKSFNKKMMWMSGNIMMLLTMTSAFLGYVLPWGQMSFWGATVITNILSSIPFLGKNIIFWVWGSFSVDNPTLNRFFSLHFMIPLLILSISMFHLMILHEKGSSNQMGFNSNKDKILFSKSFMYKDMISIFLLMLVYFYFLLLFVDQHYSMAKENFFPADPLNTPIHIKPEWYFMFAYSLLRSIPSKIGGIMSLFILFVFFFMLMFNKSHYSKFFFYKKIMLFSMLMFFIILTNLGYKLIEYPFTQMSLYVGILMILSMNFL
uniref:Cytochrome b n=1 Tax=Amphitetranychus viennensis TaxID=381746 RepID=A0A1L4AHK2_9ACAR|nr:cytochrome b [Amphitetranychus viennensis]API67782.1 cytochrome b [Amphitetranychus viennensis]